jgi:folate-binding protein YgfZ
MRPLLAWRQADLRYGLPRLEEGQREVWTQQLGLDRLNGYSVKKGCYPGQEIVARTHFLGKAKCGAVAAYRSTGTGRRWRAAGWRGLGTIASVAGDAALAVLPLEASDADLQVGDAIAQRVPLLDGLAR